MAKSLTADSVVRAELLSEGPNPFKFSILAPGDWRLANVGKTPIVTNNLSLIAVLEASSEIGVSLQIFGIALANEISAVHWLKYYISTRANWRAGELTPLDARRARASCELEIGGLEYSGLLSATVNGSTLVLLQGFCPTSRFLDLMNILNLGIRSFTTNEVATPNIIEPWINASIGPGVSFQFPESWSRRNPEELPPGRAVADWYRFDSDKIMKCFLRVKYIDRNFASPPFDAERDATLKEFEESGVTFASKPNWISLAVFEPFTNIQSIKVDAKTTVDSPLQLQVISLEYSRGLVIISCLGPHSNAAFLDWAINSRAFEIAVASLSVPGN